jgi:hypothetical protein
MPLMGMIAQKPTVKKDCAHKVITRLCAVRIFAFNDGYESWPTESFDFSGVRDMRCLGNGNT